jgi:AcrR family transcriptional regulator
MPRPTDTDARQTRARLLEAATVLFVERDFGGASLRDVARSANLSLGMVRHYFGNKEGLYEACLLAACGEFAQLSGQLVDACAVCESAAVEAAVRDAYRQAVARPASLALVCRAWGRPPVDALPVASLRRQLERAAQGLALRLGRPESEMVFSLHMLIFAILRAATEDRVGLLRVSATFDTQAVEDHLAECAKRLLGLAGQAAEA